MGLRRDPNGLVLPECLAVERARLRRVRADAGTGPYGAVAAGGITVRYSLFTVLSKNVCFFVTGRSRFPKGNHVS